MAGKRTKLNAKANRKLKELFLNEQPLSCEARLDKNCWVSAVTFAHRHKRNWYYGKPDELLWARDQVILACPQCHETLEYNKELTEETFKKLR
jgi:5-methylcytosine-specific restriction endonuclease McrA